MLRIDSPLMGTQQPALQQRYHSVCSWEQVYAYSLPALYLANVDIAFQTKIGRKPICSQGTTWCNRPCDESMQTDLGQIAQTSKADTTDPATIFFSRHNNQGLAIRLTANYPLFLAAPVGLVHLHGATEEFPAWSDHSSSQLMQQTPSRLIAANSKHPLQPKSTHSTLLAGDMPHRSKPHRKGQVATLKDCADSYRYLMAAATAQPQSSVCRPCSFPITVWTNKTVRPTKRKKVLTTIFLGGESALKIQNGFGIVFWHLSKHYRLW